MDGFESFMKKSIGTDGNFLRKLSYKKVSDKEPDSTVYTDNLFSRNPDKYNRLCQKHFGDKGQTNWHERSTENIQSFLCDWLDEDIEIVSIERKKHQIRGYPLWRIDYATLE